MLWEKTPKIPVRRPDPHWLDNINVTPELVYRYQVNARTLNDVLNDDLYALKNVHQVSFFFSEYVKFYKILNFF